MRRSSDPTRRGAVLQSAVTSDVVPTPLDTAPTSATVRDLVRDHPGLCVSGLALAVSAVWLAAVADGDPATALAVVQHAGTGSLAVGLLVRSLPLLLVALVSSVILLFPDRDWLAACAVALLILITPLIALLTLFALVLLGLAMAALWGRWNDSDENSPTSGDLRRRRWTLVLAIAGSALFLNDRMWLPLEAVTTSGSNGNEVVGYVLRTDGGQSVVLTDRDRRVEILFGELESRHICRPGRPNSITNLFMDPANRSRVWDQSATGLVNRLLSDRPLDSEPYPPCRP